MEKNIISDYVNNVENYNILSENIKNIFMNIENANKFNDNYNMKNYIMENNYNNINNSYLNNNKTLKDNKYFFDINYNNINNGKNLYKNINNKENNYFNNNILNKKSLYPNYVLNFNNNKISPTLLSFNNELINEEKNLNLKKINVKKENNFINDIEISLEQTTINNDLKEMINKLESINSPRFKNSKFLSFLKDINSNKIYLDEKNNTIIKNKNIINKDNITNNLLENSYNRIDNKIKNIPNEIINIPTIEFNNKINSYIKENNFLEAFYLLKSNEIIEKDNSKNFYLLSKIYMDFNRDDLAIEYALKSLEIDSFNINNYIILSNCYINEGNNIKSIFYMLKYLEFNKNFNQNFKMNLEGNIILNYEFIKKYMDFNVNNIKSLIDYETYEKNKNNIVLEMIKFLKVINNNNQNDIIYYFLGLCYNILSDFNESINNFKKIKNTNNNIYEIYNKIGVIYLNLNNFHESIIYFTKALESNKKYPRALSNLGVAYLNKEMYNESIKYFIKSLEIFSEQPDIWNQLLGIFLTINRDDLINIINKRDINLLKNINNF